MLKFSQKLMKSDIIQEAGLQPHATKITAAKVNATMPLLELFRCSL